MKITVTGVPLATTVATVVNETTLTVNAGALAPGLAVHHPAGSLLHHDHGRERLESSRICPTGIRAFSRTDLQRPPAVVVAKG